MTEYKYARIPLSKIPEEIINQYDILAIAHGGFVMMEIQEGMYGLPQAGIIANKQRKVHLLKYGYYESSTKDLYTHTTKPTTFTLVVDGFGICTTSRADLDHLHQALNAKYTTTIDRSGAIYLGMMLK